MLSFTLSLIFCEICELSEYELVCGSGIVVDGVDPYAILEEDGFAVVVLCGMRDVVFVELGDVSLEIALY